MTSHLSALLLEPDTVAPSRLSRPALLMVDGDVTDSTGTDYNYTPAHLKRIAKATTKYIEAGNRVIFTKDHGGDGDYKSDDVMGQLDRVWVAPITDESLPHPGMSDLIGRTGLFGQITIAGAENITRYQDGRLKEISVGIDVGGDYLGKDVIFEVSAVWKGAIRGASLFGLTLDGTLAESRSQVDDQFHTIMMAFGETVDRIKSTTEAELNGRNRADLMSQAIDDLELKLRQHLGANRPLPTPPTFAQTMEDQDPMTDDKPTTPDTPDVANYEQQVADLTAQFAALKAENELLKIQQEEQRRIASTRAKFASLKQRGDQLVAAGKLTPAAHADYFGKAAEDTEALVLRYSQPVGADEAMSLATTEAVIMHLEQYGQPITAFGSALADEPLPSRDDDLTAKQVATLTRIAREKNLSKDQAIAMMGSKLTESAIAQFKGGN